MELGELEAFVEAAQQGSFRRAAETLFLTQPSLSARIANLEHELGEVLFVRHGRGVSLAEAGRMFLPFAERALETLRQGQESLTRELGRPGRTLSLGCTRAICTYVLPEILAEFEHRKPEIEVHVRTGRSSDVLAMVVNQEVEVGLARNLHHPLIVTCHLYDEEIVLVVHPEHPLARKGTASIAEVALERLILYDRESSFFVLIDRLYREAGIVPRVCMNLDSIEATKRMIEQGLGISFLPRNSIRPELEQGILQEVHLSDTPRVSLPSCVMIRRSRHYDPDLLSFLSVPVDLFGAEVPIL